MFSPGIRGGWVDPAPFRLGGPDFADVLVGGEALQGHRQLSGLAEFAVAG